jgi:tRNA modification GTPase
MTPGIFALSSGFGAAGVAVIRVSGSDLRSGLLAHILPNAAAIKARYAHYAALHDPAAGTRIDQALVLYFPAPRSFTGEDVVELHTHGSLAVKRHLFAVLQALGFRQAQPGEFTRRAVLNGKMSLVQAEALLTLVHAETRAQKDFALQQLHSQDYQLYYAWQRTLLTEIALLEARLDFTEDTADQLAGPIDLRNLQDLCATLGSFLAANNNLQVLNDGYKIAIIGAPNVGKSSLLNALSRADTALVSDLAGTTRDVVSVTLDLQGVPVVLSDTAGLRHGGDELELLGQAKARHAAHTADLVLYLTDAHTSMPDLLTTGPRLLVLNKLDLGDDDRAFDVKISCRTGAGMPQLISLLTAAVTGALPDLNAKLLMNQRQRTWLTQAHAHLTQALTEPAAELMIQQLRSALTALSSITGSQLNDAVFDEIFARFCIGK